MHQRNVSDTPTHNWKAYSQISEENTPRMRKIYVLKNRGNMPLEGIDN